MEAQQEQLISVLKQVLVSRLRDDVNHASDFASEHDEPDNVNSNYGLDTYMSYFSQLTNAKANAFWVEGTDQVSYSGGTWDFGLNKTDHITSHMHEAAHALFSPFNHAQSVANMLKDERIHRIVNIVEDRRIEFLADLWWHGAGIYEFHRADLIRQSKLSWGDADTVPIYTSTMSHDAGWEFGNAISNDQHDSSTGRLGHGDWQAQAIGMAVMLISYDLPGLVYDPVIMDVVAKFKDKILAAGCSVDKNAAVRVAVEIANYMDWLNEPPDDSETEESEPGEGEACEDGDPSDMDGKGQNNKPSDPSDTKPEDTSQEGGNPPPAISDGEVASPKPSKTQLDEKLEQAMDITEDLVKEKKLAHLQDEVRQQKHHRPGEKLDQHNIEIASLVTRPLKPDARMKGMLDSVHDVNFDSRAVTQGVVTPRVWQMRHGNMKVFRQPPKRKGRTLVFVDMSGSMNCWCGCIGDTKGTKSWQVANAIAKAAGNAEIYGFGCGYPTGICKVPVGYIPDCKDKRDAGGVNYNNVGTDTPICGALRYAEKLIQSEASNSTLVFITDGGASTADGCERGAEEGVPTGVACTRKQAKKMADAGVDFIAVCMGTTAAFPTSVTAQLTADGDTTDVANLTTAIKHIRSRR